MSRQPSPAPTPIPACAPVLRPPSSVFWFARGLVGPSVTPAAAGAELTAVGPAVADVGMADV